MQKDVYLYLNPSPGDANRVSPKDAEKIAWADQFTDDLTEADLYGIHTQCKELGNWNESQIQLCVLVPFHFVPGDDPAHPWMTTRDCSKACELVESAHADPLCLGVALHAYQDTFSHENFSGWEEELNACFPWIKYDLRYRTSDMRK